MKGEQGSTGGVRIQHQRGPEAWLSLTGGRLVGSLSELTLKRQTKQANSGDIGLKTWTISTCKTLCYLESHTAHSTGHAKRDNESTCN